MAKAHRSPSSSVKRAIVDTSIYIALYRTAAYSDFLLRCKYLISASSVVVAELSRGARTKKELGFVRDISKQLRLITPTEADWLKSGEIVRKLAAKNDFDTQKIREIHFDVLISLSARRIGATVITANREDFLRIGDLIDFEIMIPPE